MKKKISAKKQNHRLPNLVKESKAAVKNGLSDAIGMGAFSQIPGMGVPPGTEQVSSPESLFKNLRWVLVSNFRQLLSQLYVEIGLVQTLVDLPVDDALRGGITIKSKQLDEHQIKQLQTAIERDGDLHAVTQGAKWLRLFGGSGVIILVEDQDPETPFELDKVTKDTEYELRACDMWELFNSQQNLEGDMTPFPAFNDKYDYYGKPLDRSRVMPMKGIEAPSFIRPRLRGWGFSVVEILVRSINQYLKATDLSFEVLDEFKLDVYKIKNLVNTLLSPNGDSKIKSRVQMANWQKNYQNAIVMDSEDDFDHKQLSFAGLAEAQAGIRMQVCADMRMPATKLFGQSMSGGIGNNDQNDLENYNSMVESQVRAKIKPDILRVIEIKCQKLFGMIPDDLEIEFKPLRVLSALDDETVKTQKFARLKAAKDSGDITTLEFRDACNKGGLFDVILDTNEGSLNPDDPQIVGILTDPVAKPEPVEPKKSET